MEDQHFFYRTDGCLKQLFLDEIAFLVTVDKYTHFFIEGDKVMIRVTLDDAMKLLPKNRFVRVSRSAAVAIQYIDKVTRENVYMRTDPPHVFPITRQYYPGFIRQIVILQTNPNKGRREKDPWKELEE